MSILQSKVAASAISGESGNLYPATTHATFLQRHQASLGRVTDRIVGELEKKIDATKRKKVKVAKNKGKLTKTKTKKGQNKMGAVCEQQVVDEEDQYEIIDPQSRIFFLKMRADQRFVLASSLFSSLTPESPSSVTDDAQTASVDALDTYEEAIELSNEHLVPSDILRIQLTIKTSLALATLPPYHAHDGWIVGKKGLIRAEKYLASDSIVSDEVVEALECLRGVVKWLEEKVACDEEEGENSSRRAIANEQSLVLEDNTHHEKDGKLPKIQSSLKTNGRGYSDALNKMVQRVEWIKSVCRMPTMVFDDLDHCATIGKALRRLFNSYVRGNAVHAEMKSGTYCDISGQVIDMDDYLLNGPFLNWDGFLFMLHDFHILARRDGKGGRKVNTRAGEEFLANGSGDDIKLCFVMSSIAPVPVLVPSQADIPGSVSAQNKKLWNSPIDLVTAAIPTPRSGLSFPQFCDCLARIGNLLLFEGVWRDMFPTTSERINGIFLTTMGLGDSTRLDGSLHFHNNNVIKGGEGASGEYGGMSKSPEKKSSGGRNRRRSLTTAY